jgi:hypothetical protein
MKSLNLDSILTITIGHRRIGSKQILLVRILTDPFGPHFNHMEFR